MPSLSSILIGATVILGLALGVTLTVWVPNLYKSRATIAAQRDSLLVDNATLTTERDRAKKAAAAEAERAMARQRERDGMAGALAELRQMLGDGDDACLWTPEKAQAVDKFLRGGP